MVEYIILYNTKLGARNIQVPTIPTTFFNEHTF